MNGYLIGVTNQFVSQSGQRKDEKVKLTFVIVLYFAFCILMNVNLI